jgi:hypothetical protein
MRDLPWTEAEENKYVAEMPCGRAIIEPFTPGVDDGRYIVQLELPSGEVIYRNTRETGDFEEVQGLAWVMLPLLDQVEGDLSECGRVVETLNLCQQYISRETDSIHWLRVEYIKEWLAREYTGETYKILKVQLPEYPPVEFNWLEDGHEYHIGTPYGRAIILETRMKGFVSGSIRHKAQIVHHTGAVLDCYSWVDFMEAEHAIKHRLDEIVFPDIFEEFLDYIHFTLDICARLLPEDSDPIHDSRLASLGTLIHLHLD